MSQKCMDFNVNIKRFQKILCLVDKFAEEKFITPSEFADSKKSILKQEEIYHFLKIERHLNILEEILNHFLQQNRIIMKRNRSKLILIFYFLLFTLSVGNFNALKELLLSLSCEYLNLIFDYLMQEESRVTIVEICCKYFENEYVFTNIGSPLIQNIELINLLYQELEEERAAKYQGKATVPVTMEVLQRPKKTPAPPTNTPVEPAPFKSSKIPKTTYQKDCSVEKKLEQLKEKNRLKADVLLEKAMAVKVPVLKRKEVKVEQPIPKPKYCPLPKNMNKSVEIKNNLTTIIREAAFYAKNKEAEIKKIEYVLQGGFDMSMAEKYEEELRQLEEQRQLEEIEKKRIKCLISHEEAFLAKKRLLAENREKMMAFKAEQEELRKILEKWREEENEKIRQLAEKSREIEVAMKDSEKKMVEEKQCNARLIQFETKSLLQKAYQEQQEELTRKMQLIQEMRALEQLREVHVKEFDRTECPNVGLLCEMSIAELQERLYIMKVEMEQEIEDRRDCINRKKEAKQKLIEDTKKFIEESKESKRARETPLVKASVMSMKENPDILALRKRLHEARILRMNS